MNKKCYNCGVELKKGINETKEHIPAKNLFVGYGEEYKIQRITVPGCEDCNQKYSKLEDIEFRDLIGIKEKHEIHQKISENTFKSLDENKLVIVDNNVGCVINMTDIKNYHIKNFKGLFYHKYKIPFPSDGEIYVNIDEKDNSTSLQSAISYLNRNFNWSNSGHEDVFKYILEPVRTQEVDYQNRRKSFEYSENDKQYLCLMTYNDTHSCLIIGTLAKTSIKLETPKRKNISDFYGAWVG